MQKALLTLAFGVCLPLGVAAQQHATEPAEHKGPSELESAFDETPATHSTVTELLEPVVSSELGSALGETAVNQSGASMVEPVPSQAVRPQSQPAQRSPRIQHLVIHEVGRGTTLLRFEFEAPDRTGQVVVRYRSAVDSEVHEARVQRAPTGYVAEIPNRHVQPPTLAYWVIERSPDGSERPVFANQSEPHRVQVVHSPLVTEATETLARRQGRRSESFARFDWVDFGRRQVSGQKLSDNFYLAEIGYSFHLLSWVETIHFIAGRVRGQAVQFGPSSAGMSTGVANSAQPITAGIDYGKAQLTLFLHPLARLRAGLLLGVSQDGFEYGGSADLVIGDASHTSLTLGAEAISTLGLTGRTRLGWLALPRVPMGATIEVTRFPSSSDAGVRLLYDLGYEFAPASLVRLRGGYQSRTSVTGGLSAGGEVVLAF